ncbi:hypothetical protein GT354_02020 [Streptomyces sp. SID3343]|nr:hypothetical protein [Streptomyces sp. SID3343]
MDRDPERLTASVKVAAEEEKAWQKMAARKDKTGTASESTRSGRNDDESAGTGSG